MKSHEQVTRTQIFTSEMVPEVSTTHEGLAESIAWADANPVVWKIVMRTKSAPFGKNSSTYLGCARGSSPGAILDRVTCFKHYVEDARGDSFFGWRARWTMKHYGAKGFRGGFFQQFDGSYDRGCAELDYTPDTRDEVIDRFLAWCDVGFKFPTVSVKIDDRVVREIKKPMRVRRAAV